MSLHMDALETFNQSLFLQINAGPTPPGWLIYLAIGIASGLMFLLPVLLVATWLWCDNRKRELALRIVCVIVLAVAFSLTTRHFWPHPRPFAIGLGHNYLQHAPNSSFPSDHMTVFMSVALSLLLARHYLLGLIALVAAIAVAWARVFLGIHFPLDMAGGVIVACLAWIVVALVWRKYHQCIMHWALDWYQTLFCVPMALGWVRSSWEEPSDEE